MTPCTDAGLIDHYVNHPDIRPFIGGTGPLVIGKLMIAPNVALIGEHGGFLLSWTAPGTYEIHTVITPEGRGQWAFEWAARSIDYMESIGADHLWTRIHPDHRHTAIFTRKMGLKPCGSVLTDFGDGPVAYNLYNWRKPPCQQQ